jgi:chemotaxis protein CheX
MHTEIEAEFVGPFVAGVEQMLSSMMGASCELTDEHAHWPEPFVSGIITLSGDARGQVALCFPRETAAVVVAEMLGLEAGEVDSEMLQDGVGEMTNIVAGNAKAQLASTRYAFNLSLPSIITGPNHHIEMFKAHSAAVRHFQSSLGPFCLQLWLMPPG